MPAGLPVALVMFAQAAYGPPPPKASAPAKPLVQATADTSCETAQASANTREIVICAQRPQGYRLDPDVLEAQREMRAIRHGRPNRPLGTAPQNSCATVGPMGCRGGPMINLVQAALTAAEMAERLAKGEEIGSMFITDPQPDEYQLYRAAKQRRAAKEAAAKAKAAADAAAAKAVSPKASPASLTQ